MTSCWIGFSSLSTVMVLRELAEGKLMSCDCVSVAVDTVVLIVTSHFKRRIEKAVI